VSSSNIRQLKKVIAAIQLSKHQNEHLVQVCQIPSFGSIITLFHNEPFEVSFGKRISDLTENILVVVHCMLRFDLPPNVIFSKIRQGS